MHHRLQIEREYFVSALGIDYGMVSDIFGQGLGTLISLRYFRVLQYLYISKI